MAATARAIISSLLALVLFPEVGAAFPCTVEGGKTLQACVDAVSSGEEVLLPANSTIPVDGTIFLRKNVIIRSVSPDFPATLVQKVASPSVPPTSTNPLPYGSMFLVPGGTQLDLVDAEVILFDGTPTHPGVIVSRLAQGSGKMNFTRVNIAGGKTFSPVDSFNNTGGLVAWANNGGEVTLDGVTFTDLDARDLAGAVVCADTKSKVLITGPSRLERIRGFRGPVVLARSGSTFEIQRNANGVPSFSENSSRTFGGALAVDGEVGNRPVAKVLAGNFSLNQAEEKGGHISAANADLTIADATFSGGSAAYGGGIYVNSGELVVSNAVFSSNNARVNGGGIGAVSPIRLLVSGTNFVGNTADSGGGGGLYVSAASGPQTLSANLFCENLSGGTGGDQIYAENGSTTFEVFGSLLDGGDVGLTSGIALVYQPYHVAQTSIVRTRSPALRLTDSVGQLNRNVFAYNDSTAAVWLSSAASTPSAVSENVWFDGTGSWVGPMVLSGANLGSGGGGRVGDPGWTGNRGDGKLGPACTIWPHHLRPDSVQLDEPWTAATNPANVRGFLGGAEPFSRGPGSDPWSDDLDGDGTVAIWDCDDQDTGVGRLCDGETEDTDVVDSDVGDTDVTDTGVPEVAWYGSGAGCASVHGSAGLALVALALLRRRRARR